MTGLLVILVALAIVWARGSWAQEAPRLPRLEAPSSQHQPDHQLALDLYVFSQEDGGANPLVAEGFRYLGIGLETRHQLGARTAGKGHAVFSALRNAPLQPLPASVANANVTSASTAFVTLDSSLGLELASDDGAWLVSPGLFYHHQWAYLAGGPDLEVRRQLAGGDAVVRAAYSGRYADLRQHLWAGGSGPVVDHRLTHTALLGWSQVLSPSLLGSVAFQYTRQDGLLHSTLDFVGLYDAGGAPVLLLNELLPRSRNRFQLDLRGRYSPRVGRSLGLDLSAYADDWGILDDAVEPSFETPLFLDVRWRAWYRLARQRGSRYFARAPTAPLRYMTQSSSLGSFVMHGPGMAFLIPLPGRGPTRWLLRASVLGFHRSDHLSGLGGTTGVSAEW